MRELKFRIWQDNKGYLDIAHFDGGVLIATNGIFSMKVGENDSIELFTGIKDKNGKEIYEGDILKFRGRAYEVKFDNYGQFYMENKNYHWLENGYSFRSVDIWRADGILVEVIGNIHENPELLEKLNEDC